MRYEISILEDQPTSIIVEGDGQPASFHKEEKEPVLKTMPEVASTSQSKKTWENTLCNNQEIKAKQHRNPCPVNSNKVHKIPLENTPSGPTQIKRFKSVMWLQKDWAKIGPSILQKRPKTKAETKRDFSEMESNWAIIRPCVNKSSPVHLSNQSDPIATEIEAIEGLRTFHLASECTGDSTSEVDDEAEQSLSII